ncbi:hypothetical protein RI065_08180 [Mycoplasmatota bacterium zrk1]
MDKINLEELKNINPSDVTLDDLVDIRDININTDLPKEERIIDYIKQIKNPYLYKYGKYKVKVSFTEDGPTLEELLIKSFEMSL